MTKVDIFSGFLGAGKTTLIKKLLEESFKGEKCVLIENEFGEVGVDSGFLKDSGIEITELNSGCICCTLVGDFDKNLREVMSKFSPDRILIEPSGVGKLSDVAASVIRLEEEIGLSLCGMATIVNAKKARKQMKAFGEFFKDQIVHATAVILSRSDEIGEDELSAVTDAIKEMNPKAHIITTPWKELSGEKIKDVIEGQDNLEAKALSMASHEEEEREHEHEHHHHHHDHDDHDEHDEHHHHHHGHDEENDDEHDHEHEHEHHHHDHDEHDEHEHHHHDHDDEHEHHHHHDHNDHDEHEHHHHHHHADEVFDTWGIETPKTITREKIENAMKVFAESSEYGEVIRSKGIVKTPEDKWLYFDLVDGDYEIREGAPDFTGRLVVIGVDLKEDRIPSLFGL
ncbi:MAG: GTP-binding protein [Lachnospiraceae bacterium]|nr:GTP-binding protein [Lachnospiraceae bacterium]